MLQYDATNQQQNKVCQVQGCDTAHRGVLAGEDGVSLLVLPSSCPLAALSNFAPQLLTTRTRYWP